jgi:hypothetical protein
MRLNFRWALSSLLAVTCLTLPFNTLASPAAPNVQASRSVNGRYLVTIKREYEDPNERIRTVRRTTYTVMEAENFINGGYRLNAPVPFWSERWHVTLDGREGSQTFWPMISDDGRSMILIGVTPPLKRPAVLKIYRALNSSNVELVRSYQIADLWTQERIDTFVFGDENPRTWFAGGGFGFSDGGKSLICRNQWNDIVEIKLADGTITR